MPETKSCKTCAEDIRTAARVCPHCRQGQSIFWSRSPFVVFPLSGLLFIVILFVIMPDRAILTPGAEFSDHVDQVVVRGSSFEFSDCNGTSHVSTVGMLDNTGEHGWKELHFEVRYFNEIGDLIDTVSSKAYSLILPPSGETAFRVKGAAARDRDEYVSHRVIVKHATDLAAWP